MLSSVSVSVSVNVGSRRENTVESRNCSTSSSKYSSALGLASCVASALYNISHPFATQLATTDSIMSEGWVAEDRFELSLHEQEGLYTWAKTAYEFHLTQINVLLSQNQ